MGVSDGVKMAVLRVRPQDEPGGDTIVWKGGGIVRPQAKPRGRELSPPVEPRQGWHAP